MPRRPVPPPAERDERPRSSTVATKTRSAASGSTPASAASPATSASPTVGRGAASGDTPRAGRLRHLSRRLTGKATEAPVPAAASAVRKDLSDGTVATPWARVSARLRPDNVSLRMQERLRERRSADRRLAMIRWSKRLSIAGAVAAAVWITLMSPIVAFDAGEVEANGFGTVVDPADVDAIVAAYDGEALATLNTSHLENQLTDLVGVASAQVEKVWPQGLRVTLTPSEPVAAVPAEDGGYRLVNEEGEQVSESEEAPGDLPVITVPVGEEHERILTGVLAVVEEIPAELRESVEGIEAQTEDTIHFTLRDGPQVEWGSGEDSHLKAQVLETLLGSKEAKNATLIDVSAPTFPTVTQ
ncbi:cell division protein FtsQ/DivIB [Demequina sp. NBRC 110057]|uniref:cell division protein FtsQ/DivIB n=1 Tax=Demequina sp. NBRC 110057 TaxID=1570346 RepID=UPI001356528E|nr:cell division protein FtsQ/DivIB [Demequina sp. NBRC 110057]